MYIYICTCYIYIQSSSPSHDHPTELPRSWPRSPSRTAPPRALSPTQGSLAHYARQEPCGEGGRRGHPVAHPAMAAMACFWKQEMVDWIIRNGEFPLDFPIRNDDEMLIEAAEIVNSPATNGFGSFIIDFPALIQNRIAMFSGQPSNSTLFSPSFRMFKAAVGWWLEDRPSWGSL